MKKVLLIAAMALMAFTAKAQFYVGGAIGLDAAGGNTAVEILPEIGYNLNENMSVGAVIGWDNVWWGGYNSKITISPYFRYSFLDLGPVKLFADGVLDFGVEFDTDPITGDPANTVVWGIGIRPGIAIPVSENLSFVGHIARLGYFDGTFSVGADLRNINVGLYYSF